MKTEPWATTPILRAFAGLGFEDGSEPMGNEYLLLQIGTEPGAGRDGTDREVFAVVGANDSDGEPDGFPRIGSACGVEVNDSDGGIREILRFPDAVSAFVYVRDLSGWFAPLTATGERERQRYDGSPVCSRCGWTHPAGSGPCGEVETLRIENGFWDRR